MAIPYPSIYRLLRCAAFAAAFGSSVATGQAQERGVPAAGEALALSVCANCHLVREGQRQPPMDSVPSFMALANDPAMTETRLRNFLAHPHPPMPPLELSRQQIEDLISTIATRRRAPPAR